MQRRLCSAILFLQAIVLGLSSIVLISVESVDTATALLVGLGLMTACLLAAGMLRMRWAYGLGWAIQVAAVALGVLVSAMYVLGAIFLLLWFTAYRLGATIDRDKAAVA
ncbi:MAG: hypothetical protein JWQ74_473 [Marmoricola sp.]|nr:hypothetical protein [Marmoricola sp.]